ncbi:tRNA (cytidine(34)-2'-O)-methyltransferase [uncultured Clostridium sp.]|nr:tRNA (cytidine(34)-2'-O)-methyltransferase [uncultured Clostridium sp.]
MAFHIVLVEPEIPQNTGNIARTCAATGSELHLVGKLGFSLEDRYLKRAGLDYWPLTQVHRWESLEELVAACQPQKLYYASTKSPQTYTDVQYRDGDFLVFGKETRGLPEALLCQHLEDCIRIPMVEAARSLNLSNSVAIVVYEAMRQNHFSGLSNLGKFAR